MLCTTKINKNFDCSNNNLKLLVNPKKNQMSINDIISLVGDELIDVSHDNGYSTVETSKLQIKVYWVNERNSNSLYVNNECIGMNESYIYEAFKKLTGGK